ncbi:hypothetical protein SK128_019108, partial [Halocaridina rubra]
MDFFLLHKVVFTTDPLKFQINGDNIPVDIVCNKMQKVNLLKFRQNYKRGCECRLKETSFFPARTYGVLVLTSESEEKIGYFQPSSCLKSNNYLEGVVEVITEKGGNHINCLIPFINWQIDNVHLTQKAIIGHLYKTEAVYLPTENKIVSVVTSQAKRQKEFEEIVNKWFPRGSDKYESFIAV